MNGYAPASRPQRVCAPVRWICTGIRAGLAVVLNFVPVINDRAQSAAATLILDPTFRPLPGGERDSVESLAIQADGEILAGGSFVIVNGEARFGLAQFFRAVSGQ